MKYDLTNKLHRKQFVKRCNEMLKRSCNCVELVDESKRSLKQNGYVHILIRMLAIETGVTEAYAKEIYFKQYANINIFLKEVEDKVSGQKIQYLRSTKDLTVEEMSRAIFNFRRWAEEQGFYLPDADIDDKGNVTFKNETDEQAFHQGEIEAARLENYL